MQGAETLENAFEKEIRGKRDIEEGGERRPRMVSVWLPPGTFTGGGENNFLTHLRR